MHGIEGILPRYLAPAPLPAPATPLPAAVTTAPAAFPIPLDAALTALPMPDVAALRPLFSQPCCCCGCRGTFLAGGGRGFFWPMAVVVFLGRVLVTGFFGAVVACFFCMALLTGCLGAWTAGAFTAVFLACAFTAVFFAVDVTGIFLVPMG